MYDIILADPPWNYKVWSDKGKGRSTENHYSIMKLGEISALPIRELANKNSCLFIWCISTLLPEALDVMDNWGFTYKTVAFVYVKTCRKATEKLFMGLGYWTRQNVELCLLGTRGKPKRDDRGVRQIIMSPVSRHSEKPAECRHRIERLVYGQKRLELFARTQSDGWDCLGNEISGNDISEDIQNLLDS